MERRTGLDIQAYMRDSGNQPCIVIIESDSSSAKAFASRRGLGTQRQRRLTLLSDPRRGCSKRPRDQEGTNSG